MVFVESALLAIGVATVVSAIDFIAKSTSSITHRFGIPEYLASTLVLSFVITLPVFLILLISNIYDTPVLGMSLVIGVPIATITLVMGVFLLRNELPVEFEGYRNATFMWSAALLLLILSIDKFIDRVDAIFMIALFVFYVLYIVYRTGKSTEYVFLKTQKLNVILYPLSFVAIIISSILVVGATIAVSRLLNLSIVIFGATILSSILVLPMFDVIKNVFRSSRLTFDNLLGNVVVSITLLPALVALINPIPTFMGGELGIMPLIMLNIISLSFAMLTRLTTTLHRKTGALLIVIYIIYMALTFSGYNI
jgi:Ca2+/Na+ antiporter